MLLYGNWCSVVSLRMDWFLWTYDYNIQQLFLSYQLQGKRLHLKCYLLLNVLVLHWSKNALLLNVLVLQWLKGVTELLKLQSVTKIMWLPPTAPLINIGCKFTWSFLTTTAWHSLLRLGTTLNQGEGGFWVSLSKSNIFLGLFRENIVSLDHFCDWLQFLITTKIIFCSTLKHHSFWYIQMHHFKKQCFYYSIWTCIWL